MDVDEAIQEYLATLTRLEPLSRVNYTQKLRVFSAWVTAQNSTEGRKPITLETVNDRVISEFVEHLKKEHHSNEPGKAMSSHTLAGYVRQIKTFLNWCLSDDIYSSAMKELTIRKIKLPKMERFVKETFTDEQLELMRGACEKEYNEHLRLRAQCILALLLCTGVRANELCTLKIQDMHLEPARGYIKVHGKGNKWREVPLINLGHLYKAGEHPQIDHKTRRLLKLYKERYRADASPSDSFFVDRTLKLPIGTDALEKLLSRLEYQAEITEVPCNPHRFRHSFAARFMQSIGDIYLLSKILGHTSISITEHYLKSLSGTEVRFALMKRMRDIQSS